MDYILFGIQGSGKGTQGKVLAKERDMEYFEAGGELRKLAKEDSDLARKVKEIMERGDLVPVEVIMEIVESFVSKLPEGKGVVFDGIPRNEDQRALFEELMQKLGKAPIALLIEIPEEEAIRRITNRWMSKSTGRIYMSKELALEECSEDDIYQRADDNEESIRVRINAYKKETVPVINWYREQGRFIEVDGTPPIEEVTQLVDQAVGQ
jgi:adenylate kinase